MELAGIHPEDGHRIRIRICLAEIEKVKPFVKNIALRSITPSPDSLKVEFGLKVLWEVKGRFTFYRPATHCGFVIPAPACQKNIRRV